MYKTILVHVDGSPRAAERIDAAARLALTFESHLIGTALTGLSPHSFPMGGSDPTLSSATMPIEQLRAGAERVLDAFEARVRTTAVGSFERRCMDEEAGMGLSLQARYCDLVVIGQSTAGAGMPVLRSDFPEYVLLHGARPVLVLPAQGQAGTPGAHVTVGWNGSASALRAITSAIALLQRARRVDLVVFDADPGLHGELAGADMALYLARHGVRVELGSAHAGANAGAALVRYACDSGADLIVMGAHGRARFRAVLLGDATRAAMLASPLPLWMAH